MTELLFGVGVPASAAPGADPVALAREAERLGFDFVSLPDHPCGPDPSYEATVLMTWIAAQTSRIKVASCVLAVPFRRQAMLAKLAVSLDLLSGGRLILGLGGGYSDSEITALGSPALSPAEKVNGLAEAIQVIRGSWTQPGYSQDGRHHSVRDLEMEPRPARPIPVWTGAFGPRALAVTGRLADGWIPSLGYMPTEDIPAMRHRIDAAAEAATAPPGRPRHPQPGHPHRPRRQPAARLGHRARPQGHQPATRPPRPRLHRIQLQLPAHRPRPESQHAAHGRRADPRTAISALLSIQRTPARAGTSATGRRAPVP